MKKLIASLLLVPVILFAGGGTFVVPAGATRVVVPPIAQQNSSIALVNSNRLVSADVWASNTTYAAGQVTRIPNYGGFSYVVQVGGTSSNVAPAIGAASVSDGTVTWLRCPTAPRTGVVVQFVSGSSVTLNLAGGSLTFTAAGSTFSVAAPSCYDGAISVTAIGANATISTITW